jgi:hypothetical protein
MVLNGRLPKTTARAVLSIVVFGGRSSAQRAINLPRVETIPGGRLFNEICGQARAETNIASSLGQDPKRPARRSL